MSAQKRQPLSRCATYCGAGQTFVADSCRPLVAAAEAGLVRLHALGRAGYPGQRLAADELPGLRSVGCWNAELQQNWGLPLHRNEGIELTFLATGEIACRIENRRETLRHDQFLVTRPWQPHQLGDPQLGPSCLIWLILDVGVRRPHQTWRWPSWIVLSADDREELTQYLRQNEQFIWPGSPDLRRCFLGMARALEPAAAGRYASRLAVLINAVLLAVLENFRARRISLRASLTSAERTLQQFIEELQQSLAEPWTLDQMAESCHMGVTQFVHHFRKVTNLTPARFLLRARVRWAGELLKASTAQSITEVAMTCGFSSSQHFANVFTRQMGCPPRTFRARQRPDGIESA